MDLNHLNHTAGARGAPRALHPYRVLSKGSTCGTLPLTNA
jgi:hypothetical protein